MANITLTTYTMEEVIGQMVVALSEPNEQEAGELLGDICFLLSEEASGDIPKHEAARLMRLWDFVDGVRGAHTLLIDTCHGEHESDELPCARCDQQRSPCC